MLASTKQNGWGAQGETWARLGIAVVIGISLLVGLGGRNAALAHDGEDNPSLSGTWKVSVTLTNPQTGVPLPLPQNPFLALNTFEQNGTMLETGSRGLFRSPGHGTWEHTGPHVFRAHWLFFLFAPDGSYIGTQETTKTMRLTSHDTFTADAIVTIRDEADNVVRSGAATEKGARF